jgi:hypothetical protein
MLANFGCFLDVTVDTCDLFQSDIFQIEDRDGGFH